MSVTLEYFDKLDPVEPYPLGRPQPLQQSVSYHRANRLLGGLVHRAGWFNGQGELLGQALVTERHILKYIHIRSIMRGPIWHMDDTSVQTEALKLLAKSMPRWRGQFCLIQPEMTEGSDADNMMRQAGLRRVMSGFSTAWLDLRPSESDLRAGLLGKWRNQLKRAEAENLTVTVGSKDRQYQWLLEREAEQRQTKRYQALPLELLPAYVAVGGKDSVISVTATHKGEKVAGALFLKHGNSATYHIGWSGERGRKLYAQNQVLWRGVLALKKSGTEFLDLGGMDTERMAGLARFKLGVGCKPITLAGSYL